MRITEENVGYYVRDSESTSSIEAGKRPLSSAQEHQTRFVIKCRRVHGCIDVVTRSVDPWPAKREEFHGHLREPDIKLTSATYPFDVLKACRILNRELVFQAPIQGAKYWDVMAWVFGFDVLALVNSCDGIHSTANGILGTQTLKNAFDLQGFSLEPLSFPTDPNEGFRCRVHAHSHWPAHWVEQNGIEPIASFRQWADLEPDFDRGGYPLPNPHLLLVHHLACPFLHAKGVEK